MRFARLFVPLGLTILTACNRADTAATPPPPPTRAAQPTPTASPRPTETPLPLAATVNGQPILLADFEAEVARYEAGAASMGRDLAAEGDYRARVLEQMVINTLVLQAAAGLTVSDADVQAAYDQAVSDLGGQADFDLWLAANLLSPDEFRTRLREGLLAAAVRSRVAAAVPAETEQVHARQILLATSEEAEEILAQLAAGADFAALAAGRSIDQSSRVNGGDLGWFPPAGLTVPEVAQAAFALESNQLSGVIQSALGYHIVQTLERGVRPLPPTALTRMQQQAIDAWQADLRASADVKTFVP